MQVLLHSVIAILANLPPMHYKTTPLLFQHGSRVSAIFWGFVIGPTTPTNARVVLNQCGFRMMVSTMFQSKSCMESICTISVLKPYNLQHHVYIEPISNLLWPNMHECRPGTRYVGSTCMVLMLFLYGFKAKYPYCSNVTHRPSRSVSTTLR